MTFLEEASTLFQISASIAAAIALIISLYTFKKSRDEKQYNISQSLTHQLSLLFEELYKMPNQDINQEEYDKNIHIWSKKLFAELEWFSFLVGKNQITKKEIIQFFKNDFIKYHDEILFDVSKKEQLKQKNYYPNFRKFVTNIKNGKYDK